MDIASLVILVLGIFWQNSTLNSEYYSPRVESRLDLYVRRKKKTACLCQWSTGWWLAVCLYCCLNFNTSFWMQTVLFCFVLHLLSSVWQWQLPESHKGTEGLSSSPASVSLRNSLTRWPPWWFTAVALPELAGRTILLLSSGRSTKRPKTCFFTTSSDMPALFLLRRPENGCQMPSW